MTSWRLEAVRFICLLTLSMTTAANEELSGGLTDEELNLSAPDAAFTLREPVPASEATEVVLEGIVEFGYQDELGRHVVDVLERDQAYLGVRVTTLDGAPVVGAVPSISINGSSRLLLKEMTSAEDGVLNFGVIGGQMGLDTVTANIGSSRVEFAINVISLQAAGFPTLKVLEDGLRWDELMQAEVRYTDRNLVAKFPESIQARAGKTVKLTGFMMPLDPNLKQKHFLLTSNPPSCFFHVPGGAAGSVEVVATEGISVSWDPIILEGRFEPQETSEIGVVYRLLDAKQVQ